MLTLPSICLSILSDINCKECGSHFSPCIASGQSILAKDYVSCKTCKHKALRASLQTLKLRHCTLCHAKLEPTALDAGAEIAVDASGAGAPGANRRREAKPMY